MNVFTGTGNLGRDAEHRTTPNQKDVVTFSIPVKSGFGQHEKTSWMRCSIWGKRGTSLLNYLKKGQMVSVTGEINLNEYKDKDNNMRASFELNVGNITLCGRVSNNQGSAQQSNSESSGFPEGSFSEDEPAF